MKKNSKDSKEPKMVIKKKVSKTWKAFLRAEKNPGIEIVDMKAVLK
jgi:hypothetical protein